MKPARVSLPYYTSSESSIMPGRWHLRDAKGDDIVAGEKIEGWDYDFPLIFRRRVEIDLAAVRKDCFLPMGTPIDLAITAVCLPARFRQVVGSVDGMGERIDRTIQVELDSAELAGILSLETELLLGEDVRDAKDFAAHIVSSRLYSDSVSFELEGTASRFPVEVVEFETSCRWIRANEALWFLQWNPADLELPLMGNLQLLINSRNETFVARATANEPELSNVLGIDVARQMISQALESDQFDDDPAGFPEGSLGEAAYRLIQVCFPGTSIADVKALYRNERSRFEAQVQAGARVSDG